jgi:hypothetical protein
LVDWLFGASQVRAKPQGRKEKTAEEDGFQVAKVLFLLKQMSYSQAPEVIQELAPSFRSKFSPE